MRQHSRDRRNIDSEYSLQRELEEGLSRQVQQMETGTTQIRKRKRKKKKIIRRVVFCTVAFASIVIGNIAARVTNEVNLALNTMQRDVDDLSDVDLSEIELVDADEIVNILLIGSDKRADWSEAGRSDSVMIATIDMRHKQLKLTSLMRDMYVAIPGYSDNRFNAAYSFGGVSLLYQTIATNFQIKLDGYVVVDFEAFTNVIDTIGGVEITLTQKEYEYLTTAYKKGDVLKLKEGTNLMNGTQALAYVRIRQDSAGDFGRTQRQRTVMDAIFTEVKSSSFNELIQLVKEVLPNVSTDMTNKEIFSYLKSILSIGNAQIQQFRIPIDDSYKNVRIDGKAVLSIDLELNKQELHNFLFN